MSASKDKILRKEEKANGIDKKAQAQAKAAAERRKSNIKYTVVAIVLVIALAFVFFYNSAIPSRQFTAVTIDGEEYSVAQLNYYYSSSFMNFYNTYYDYVSSGLFFDPSVSLDEQNYTEDMTWREYFLDTAIQTMVEVQVLNEAAEAAGFVLSAEYEEQYNTTVENFKTEWQLYGYSSLEQYINLSYGKGVTMELLEEELYRNFVASAYSEAVFEGYEYTTAELDAYYAEHANELDMITFSDVSSIDGTLDVDSIAAAVDGTDEDTFMAYMAENHEGNEPATFLYPGSSLSDVYGEWLLDSARQPGDAAAFTSDSGANYAIMFLNRDNNDYPTVNFRHILINAEDADGDGAFSQEEIDLAANTAKTLYEEWLAGDATEDTFAELATLNSDDTGSVSTGGLYENVYHDAMVDPIDDWIFDSARQPGDTELISYAGDNYTGTHIIYFVGEDDMTYAHAQAESAMANEAYTTWLTGLTEGIEPATKNLGLAAKHI